MCGRYTLSEVPEWSELRIHVPDELLVRPRYNAAPGRPQLVVTREGTDGLKLGEIVWGARAGERMTPNARMESLGWPKWRDHLERCVVPADGFVEWRKVDGKKEPLWIRRPGGGRLLWLAGLVVPEGFVIVTTPPSADVAPIHDRMPAILAPKRVGAWLDSPWDEARQLLQPAPAGLLEAVRISTRINSVANDDRACLEPEPDGRQFGLF